MLWWASIGLNPEKPVSRFSSVQLLSHVQFCDPMDCSMPGFPVHYQLPELAQTHVHWVSDAIQPSHPLSPPSPPTFNLSQHQGLCQWVSSLHQEAKVLELQLQHQSFQWTFRTISFRMDLLDLLVVQGTLKSLLQHHSSKTSILQWSAFFTVQLSHPDMTTEKTIAFTRWTFVGKVMSLLFNMLSKVVIAFLPRRKCLLISWLQSPSVVILEPKKWSPKDASGKMPGWMKHKLESRVPGEISITSDTQVTPLIRQKVKRNWGASWWNSEKLVEDYKEIQPVHPKGDQSWVFIGRTDVEA